LDNGLGICFVVDDDRKFLGRIRLEELRHALREGMLLAGPSLGDFLEKSGIPRDGLEKNDQASPQWDGCGRLSGITVDYSQQFIHIARPDLSHTEFRFALDAFLSSWISSTGAYVQQFQEDFAAFIGRRRGIAVSAQPHYI